MLSMMSVHESVSEVNSFDKCSLLENDDDKSISVYDETFEEPRLKKRRKQSNPVKYQTSPPPTPINYEDSERHQAEIAESGKRNIHNGGPIENAKFLCLQCCVPFETDHELTNHIKTEHVSEAQSQRQTCIKSVTSDNLNKDNAVVSNLDFSHKVNEYAEFKSSELESLSVENDCKEQEKSKNLKFILPKMPPLIPLYCDNDKQHNSSSLLQNSRNVYPLQLFTQGQNPSMTNRSAVTSSGVRIFNPEAYCELCDKEFCNKYFLKTHKANKHGVYTPESNTNSYQISSPINSPRSSLASFLPSDNSPQKQGFQNVEAYCEICQKEFCNKYFLKKHRVNIHGMPEQPDSDSERANLKNLPIVTSLLSGTTVSEKSRDAEIFCDTCKVVFPNIYAIQTHNCSVKGLATSDGLDLPTSQSAIAHYERKPLLQSGSPQSKDNLCHVPSAKVENKIMEGNKESLVIEKLKYISSSDNCIIVDSTIVKKESQMSVDTFPSNTDEEMENGISDHCEQENEFGSGELSCDLCSRSFQTLNLLNLHKVHMHGALSVIKQEVCPTEVADKMPELIQTSSNDATHASVTITESENHHKQSSPKGGDHISNFTQMPYKQQDLSSSANKDGNDMCVNSANNAEGFLEGHTPSAMSSSIDCGAYCEICQKEFCSKYFLRTHKQNIHGIMMESSSMPRRASVLQLGSSQNNLANGLQVSPTDNKVLPTARNFCNICNKELCNKYFMKTHMLKMHGINIECTPEGSLSNLGGVICDICGKELCSKYFLKVHKVNCHGVNEESHDKEFSFYNSLAESVNRKDFRNGTSKDLLLWTSNQDHSQENMPSTSNLTDKCHREYNHELPEKGIDIGKEGFSRRNSSDTVIMNTSSFIGRDSNDISKENLSTLSESPRHWSSRERKLYNCSVCNYSTHWLSNLYAHERRHAHLLSQGDKRYACHICHKAFQYSNSLQHHLLSHRTLNVNSQITSAFHISQSSDHTNIKNSSSSLIGSPQNASRAPLKVKRYRCSKCNKRFRTRERCLVHIHATHKLKRTDIEIKNGSYIEYSSPSDSTFMNSERGVNHQDNDAKEKDTNNFQTSVNDDYSEQYVKEDGEVSRVLPPVRIPMPYVMPKDQSKSLSIIMQPFLIAEPHCDGAVNKDTFVPSLVYLPVSKKISHPVTVSFTLTPA